MFTIKGVGVLRGLLTNRTKRRCEIIRVLIKSSFIVYFKRNISSKVIIIYFTR